MVNVNKIKNTEDLKNAICNGGITINNSWSIIQATKKSNMSVRDGWKPMGTFPKTFKAFNIILKELAENGETIIG